MEFTADCTLGTDGENEICTTLQEGFTQLVTSTQEQTGSQATFYTDFFARHDVLNNMVIDILEYTNLVGFYLFLIIVFTVVYLISRFIWRLIYDVSMGW